MAMSVLEDSSKSSSKWQMEMLMEKLRTKAASFHSLPESAKAIRQAILNKQYFMDQAELSSLKHCLEKLQANITVTNLSVMVERLQASAKQLGLRLTLQPTIGEVYISCDMFYVELQLTSDGKCTDVRVELAGDHACVQSSPELIECLNKGNFAEFAEHLDGFLSFYKLNTEKKNKVKGYQALQALENDLLQLFEITQETITDVQKLIFKSPVGFVIRRKGGHPEKLIYMTSPYELLDPVNQKSLNLTTELVNSMDFLHTVTVNIEASTNHKLQMMSVVKIVEGADGLRLPSISGLNTANSVVLPAYFTLTLKSPMPISCVLAAKIAEVTGIQCYESASKKPMLQLILDQARVINKTTNKSTSNNLRTSEDSTSKRLVVSLPDQLHSYFISSDADFEGALIEKIPFTHPTNVAHILELMRAQAVFNTLISSCVRPDNRTETTENSFTFEVSAKNHDLLSIVFEHTDEDTTAICELDLADFYSVKCRLFTLDSSLDNSGVEEYATKVLQRCLSVPVTMRAVLKKIIKEEKIVLPLGDSAVRSDNSVNDANMNNKFCLSEYNSLGLKDGLTQGGNLGPKPFASSAASMQPVHSSNSPLIKPNNPAGYGLVSGPSGNVGFTQLKGSIGGLTSQQKSQFQSHFLSDSKSNTKLKKRKSFLDDKIHKFVEEISIEHIKKEPLDGSDGFLPRKDVKVEKISQVQGLNKRRSSTEGSLGNVACDLNALREKVYGVGSAANFAKLSYLHNKEIKDLAKFKKQKPENSSGTQYVAEAKKSIITVLDLTDNETAKKPTVSSAHSSALSAALSKRPGIECIPIPGSNTPISIPSSITVTPVMKSTEDKYNREKKERKDKKELEKKKRKREDSPSNINRCITNTTQSSSSLNVPNKSSKIQISGSKPKQQQSTIESQKTEKFSSMPIKSNFASSMKKPTLSPVMSQGQQKNLPPLNSSSKVSFNSPVHKSTSNKLTYTPSQSTSRNSTVSTSNSKTTSSPKSSSPKSSNSSPKSSNSSPKHSSLGKPSMNALKTTSPGFSKPSSISPKLSKSFKEKISSPTSSSGTATTVHSGTSNTSSLVLNQTKSKLTPNVGAERVKPVFSEALTITKVTTSGESPPRIPLSPTFTHSSSHASLLDKISAEKAKASPPKNRKGSSLDDIVEKLRKERAPKVGGEGTTDSKKDDDKFLKANIAGKNTLKYKSKETQSKNNSASNLTTSPSKLGSGLKPGVLSAPASKKVSVSSLPSIPKLPPSCVANSLTTSVSPLSMTSNPNINREKQFKDKEIMPRGMSDKPKFRESSKLVVTPTSAQKKDTLNEKRYPHSQKDEYPLSKSVSIPLLKNSLVDPVDRALKSMFGEPDIQSTSNAKSEKEKVAGADFSKKAVGIDFSKKTAGVDYSKKTAVVDFSKNKEKRESSENLKSSEGLMYSTKGPNSSGNKKADSSLSAFRDHIQANLSGRDHVLNKSKEMSVRDKTNSTNTRVSSPQVSVKIVKSPAPVSSPVNALSPPIPAAGLMDKDH